MDFLFASTNHLGARAPCGRDPQVWGADAERFDPDRFDPDRFDAAAVRARPPHTFKPFGTGARACVGRRFALHEATLVLGLRLRRYELRPAPAYRLRVAVRLTLMPDGLRLSLDRRTVDRGVRSRPAGAVVAVTPSSDRGG